LGRIKEREDTRCSHQAKPESSPNSTLWSSSGKVTDFGMLVRIQ